LDQDGGFLYTSNRSHDSVIDPKDGMLVTMTPSGGKIPRISRSRHPVINCWRRTRIATVSWFSAAKGAS
jgi:hypothetical protein